MFEVSDLPVPGAEHPERVEDDGHAGEPHDGVRRLERRLHAAPHHPPRHAAAAAVTNPGKSQDQLRPLFFLLVLPSLGYGFTFCRATKQAVVAGSSNSCGRKRRPRVWGSCFFSGRGFDVVAWRGVLGKRNAERWTGGAAGEEKESGRDRGGRVACLPGRRRGRV